MYQRRRTFRQPRHPAKLSWRSESAGPRRLVLAGAGTAREDPPANEENVESGEEEANVESEQELSVEKDKAEDGFSPITEGESAARVKEFSDGKDENEEGETRLNDP